MKLDFSQIITDLKGEPIKGSDDALTLGEVTSTTMIAIMPDDQSLTAEDKVKMFRIAQLAVKGGEQELKIEDIGLLKKRIGKMYGALIVGRVFDLIEGTPDMPRTNGKDAQLPAN
jgi:hypothetical protein